MVKVKKIEPNGYAEQKGMEEVHYGRSKYGKLREILELDIAKEALRLIKQIRKYLKRQCQ